VNVIVAPVAIPAEIVDPRETVVAPIEETTALTPPLAVRVSVTRIPVVLATANDTGSD